MSNKHTLKVRADIIENMFAAYGKTGPNSQLESAEIEDDISRVMQLGNQYSEICPEFKNPNLEGLDFKHQIITLKESLAHTIPMAMPGMSPTRHDPQSENMANGSRWKDSRGNAVKSFRRGEPLCQTDLKSKFGPCPAGDYLRGVTTGSFDHNPEIRAALAETGNGQTLVPTEFAEYILDLARAESVMDMAGATTVPMTSDRLVIARQTGDVTITVHAENTDDMESTPTFDSVGLTAYTIGAVVYISRELAMDSPMASEHISMAMAKAIAAAVDKFGLAGTGSSEPKGLTLSAGNDIAAVGSPTWADVVAGILANQVDNYSSNALILSPTRMMDLNLLLVNSEVNHYASPPPVAANLMHLQTTAIDDAVGLVLDGTKCIIGVRDGMRIESTVVGGNTFAKHQVGLKISGRFGFAVSHPNAVCTLSGLT